MHTRVSVSGHWESLWSGTSCFAWLWLVISRLLFLVRVCLVNYISCLCFSKCNNVPWVMEYLFNWILLHLRSAWRHLSCYTTNTLEFNIFPLAFVILLENSKQFPSENATAQCALWASVTTLSCRHFASTDFPFAAVDTHQPWGQLFQCGIRTRAINFVKGKLNWAQWEEGKCCEKEKRNTHIKWVFIFTSLPISLNKSQFCICVTFIHNFYPHLYIILLWI